ncbi:putative inorganic anion transmembrane transporter protein [Thermochaetoides thermophila DSM 1495]|uniref:Nitrate/nitrite transporter n=1 Tax=Chaetomium thermophilum (strain DSM 1495 / CBS 144.50 / IMI 039719) TaxID=759272 RepID=G0SF82_CHATD|nr:putative inorganic anion transmembrane transporter protein [Thermochaetoides thermophila DSM 1495]EGS18098.1 putative inorganic anion transmembrane transporter protein [Thermochaetoides thermophila DSM 1495]
MSFKLRYLYASPEVNPVTLKARSIPFLNPLDIYGRVFFFSWFGFMIAFWAWYTFPPLLSHVIKYDLHLSPVQVANSNIVSLCATLLVRLISGPLCDRFGPRKVFGGLLLVGSIPLGLAPLVHDATSLYISRFFIGILGGSFVPCQVWSTSFFDVNIVGTANAITGGFGNAGGGITYFIMPAVYDALVSYGYAPAQAWRLTFLVPLCMVITTGVALLLLCPDTPAGKWNKCPLKETSITASSTATDIPNLLSDKPLTSPELSRFPSIERQLDLEKPLSHIPTTPTRSPASASNTLAVLLSPQTFFHTLTYLASFGSELAINSILSSFYLATFPSSLIPSKAANLAAIFGFLNFITRPLGGAISDFLYAHPPTSKIQPLWYKKAWILSCGLLSGTILLILSRFASVSSPSQATIVVLVVLAAVFLEAGNGANFSLLPHVHPEANGLVSGLDA